MLEPVLEVEAVGPLMSLQDEGRPGWRRFGLAPGGALDRHSLRMANHFWVIIFKNEKLGQDQPGCFFFKINNYSINEFSLRLVFYRRPIIDF